MRDIAITFIVFIGLIYTLKKPYIGILLWSWLGYMNPHRLSFGFAYTAPFAQITAIVTMISLLFSKEKKSFPVTPITITWLLFILYMSIGTIFAIYPEEAFLQLIKVYKIQLVIFLTFLLINDKEKINQLIWVITFSIGYFTIKGGLFTLLTGGSFRVWGPPGTYIEGNNEIGVAALMILPFFLYLRTQVENVWFKRFLLICFILTVFTILGTQSRGAFLGLGAIMFFLWLKTNNKLVIGVLGILLISIALAFMPDSFHKRMDTIETYEEDASAMGRINAWTLAVNIASDRFFAGGFNHWSSKTFQLYAPVPEDVHDAHSIYFEVLGEQGYLGLILFLTIGILTWKNTKWILIKTKSIEELKWSYELTKMIQVSLIAYATAGAFLGLGYWDLPYHIVAVVVMIRTIVEKHLKTKPIKKSEGKGYKVTKKKKKWAWENE